VTSVPATESGQPVKKITIDRIRPRANHDTYGFQLQTDWLPRKNHYLIAGIDYWKKNLHSIRDKQMRIEVLNPTDNSVMQTIDKTVAERPLPVSSYRSAGVFLQDEAWLYDDRLSLTLSARYDDIITENQAVFTPLYEIVDGIRNDNPQGQQVLWHAQKSANRSWSGNMAMLYRFNKNLRFTFFIAKAFRSPYLEERYLFVDLGNIVKIGEPYLQPEKSNFGDMGISWHSPKINIKGNAFINRLYNLVTDKHVLFEGRSALKKSNVGKAILYGFEALMDWDLSKSWNVSGSMCYVRGEDSNKQIPLPFIPPFNGRLAIRWCTIHLFDLELSATLFADQKRVSEGEVETDGYVYFDAYLSSKPVRTNSFSSRLILAVENFTNASYRNHLSTNRGGITVEPGRNVLARWTIEF